MSLRVFSHRLNQKVSDNVGNEHHTSGEITRKLSPVMISLLYHICVTESHFNGKERHCSQGRGR